VRPVTEPPTRREPAGGTIVAQSTQLYLRYDGDIGSGTDNPNFNPELSLHW
jgi:hypothetical protein